MTTIWSGLATGAIYALVAIGYNITFVWAGLLNFAHAQFIVVGCFVAYWGLSEQGLPVVVVLALVTVAGAVLGVAEERLAIRPLAGRGGHNELVTTVGTATIITGILLVIWGPDPLRVPFVGPGGTLTLLGGRVTTVELLLIGLAVSSGIAIHIWSKKTRAGLAGLARVEDAEAAALRGVNVSRMSFLAFAAAGGFGGLLGVLVGPETFAVAFLGTVLAVKGFVALTLGGVGSQMGAVIGGLLVGLAEAMSARWVGADFANGTVFLLFLAVLLLRPTGLFGGRALRTV